MKRPWRSGVLTRRETQVLELMAQGLSNSQIGKTLWVSEDTVKSHGRRIYRKTSTDSRLLAVLEAMRRGVIPCACTRGLDADLVASVQSARAVMDAEIRELNNRG